MIVDNRGGGGKLVKDGGRPKFKVDILPGGGGSVGNCYKSSVGGGGGGGGKFSDGGGGNPVLLEFPPPPFFYPSFISNIFLAFINSSWFPFISSFG